MYNSVRLDNFPSVVDKEAAPSGPMAFALRGEKDKIVGMVVKVENTEYSTALCQLKCLLYCLCGHNCFLQV
jgi:hypothetical protein